MRILLLGKNGQVGWELQNTLAPLGELIAVDLPEVDFLVNRFAEELVNIVLRKFDSSIFRKKGL